MLKKVLFFSFSCILIVSCSKEDILFELKNTKGSWHKDSIVAFNFEAQDTINNFDMFLHVRNTEEYKYNNLYVITSLYYPKGKVEVDTLEYYMAYPDGRLMGEGKKVILYIDDDQDCLDGLRIVLEAHGYEMVEARSAQETIG